jgi:hypothetical protein
LIFDISLLFTIDCKIYLGQAILKIMQLIYTYVKTLEQIVPLPPSKALYANYFSWFHGGGRGGGVRFYNFLQGQNFKSWKKIYTFQIWWSKHLNILQIYISP